MAPDRVRALAGSVASGSEGYETGRVVPVPAMLRSRDCGLMSDASASDLVSTWMPDLGESEPIRWKIQSVFFPFLNGDSGFVWCRFIISFIDFFFHKKGKTGEESSENQKLIVLATSANQHNEL